MSNEHTAKITSSASCSSIGLGPDMLVATGFPTSVFSRQRSNCNAELDYDGKGRSKRVRGGGGSSNFDGDKGGSNTRKASSNDQRSPSGMIGA
jgi:hypothetical protein